MLNIKGRDIQFYSLWSYALNELDFYTPSCENNTIQIQNWQYIYQKKLSQLEEKIICRGKQRPSRVN